MVLREDILSRLRELFGLNLYEVKIWSALLSRGVSTAGELSDISGVPRSRAYDILESLEKKGFVMMKLGKPIKFMAIKPEEVVERAKKNFIEMAKEKGKILDEVKGSELLNQLNEIYTKGMKYVEPHELSGAIRGTYNITNHLESIITKAQKEVLISTTEKGIKRKANILKSAIKKLAKRGVRICVAVPVNKDNIDACKEIAKIAEVRNCNVLSRVVIVDRKFLTFMLMDDKEIHPNYDIGIWTNSEFIAGALAKMFEAVWEKAQPLPKNL